VELILSRYPNTMVTKWFWFNSLDYWNSNWAVSGTIQFWESVGKRYVAFD